MPCSDAATPSVKEMTHALSARVGGAAPGQEARDAGDVQHRAGAAVDHSGQHGPGQLQHGGHVDLQLPGQVGGVVVQERRAQREPGVVDEQVDRGEVGIGEAAHDAGPLVRFRQVGRQHLDDHAEVAVALRGGLEAVGVARHEHEVAAVGGEPIGERGTDPRRRARDHDGGHAESLVRPHPTGAGATVADGPGVTRTTRVSGDLRETGRSRVPVHHEAFTVEAMTSEALPIQRPVDPAAPPGSSDGPHGVYGSLTLMDTRVDVCRCE